MSASILVFLIVGLALVGFGVIGMANVNSEATGFLAALVQNRNLYLFLGIFVLVVVLYRIAYNRSTTQARHVLSTVVRYLILVAVGILMVYPLLWMVGATFKDNVEIFTSIGLIPRHATIEGYKAAMNDYGGDINIWKAMLNTYKYVLPRVVFTVLSSTVTAYGFSRFNFRGRKLLFALLLSTLFLPQVVLNIPQYLMYSKFGWVDSPHYLALIVPSLFAQETYFVYMLIQFMRGIPRDLDEAAKIDGCGVMKTLALVLVPMLWPAMVSAALFQFMWSSNDFMGPLLYVKTPANYPATLFVRLSMDGDSGFNWNRVLAISLISIIPSLVVFFMAQSQFMDGITAGAVKG